MPQYATCMGQSENCASAWPSSWVASTNSHWYAGIETQTQPLAMQPTLICVRIELGGTSPLPFHNSFPTFYCPVSRSYAMQLQTPCLCFRRVKARDGHAPKSKTVSLFVCMAGSAISRQNVRLSDRCFLPRPASQFVSISRRSTRVSPLLQALKQTCTKSELRSGTLPPATLGPRSTREVARAQDKYR